MLYYGRDEESGKGNRMETVLITDSCCDLPASYTKAHGIHVVPLSITIEGETVPDRLAETLEYESFYAKILEGAMPQTSQINVHEFKEVFSHYVNQNKAVIYVGFSSPLSGCVASAHIALEEIREENPEAQIFIVDSRCASMGQGLLVAYGAELLQEGKCAKEVVQILEECKLDVNHYFTVADLNHLFRGGRLSRASATFGSLLQIKPILHIDAEGRLVPIEKVKGRKKSLRRLVEKVKEELLDPENQKIFISHGAALEEAEEVKKMLQEECKVKEVLVNYIGATIGSHAGPGTIAVFFMGKSRKL